MTVFRNRRATSLPRMQNKVFTSTCWRDP